MSSITSCPTGKLKGEVSYAAVSNDTCNLRGEMGSHVSVISTLSPNRQRGLELLQGTFVLKSYQVIHSTVEGRKNPEDVEKISGPSLASTPLHRPYLSPPYIQMPSWKREWGEEEAEMQSSYPKETS